MNLQFSADEIVPPWRGARLIGRWFATFLFACIAVAAPLVPAVVAQEEAAFPRRHHAWARFEPGAWKTVRAITESFDKDGKLISTNVALTKTSLVAINGSQVTLRLEGTVNLGGQDFDSDPIESTQRLCGAAVDQKVTLKVGGKAKVTIDGETYECSVIESVAVDAEKKTITTTKIYFSDSVSTHVLRREIVTVDAATKEEKSRTTISAYALDMPRRIFTQIRPTSIFKAVYVNGETRKITWAVSSADVPGEIISNATPPAAGSADTEGGNQAKHGGRRLGHRGRA
ncbi:MAG: hypothetical protein IID44_13200 [Planctomycetes bacterium]|nr:hypothetical protein [Planctomycetota bacterium]